MPKRRCFRRDVNPIPSIHMRDHQNATPSDEPPKYILVLPTTHHTLLAENLLQSVNVRYLPVPKPQKALSDCGMAVEISADDLEQAREVLTKRALDVKIFLKDRRGEVKPLIQSWKDLESDK